jgi:hypothetical protein
MSLKQKQIKHLKSRINELDETIKQARLKKRMGESAHALSVILENDLEQAEIILAIKDLSDRLQKMAESVARMNAEDVLPLVDQMRGIFGPKKSDAFSESATDGLNVIMDAIKHAKEGLGNQILNLEGKPFEAEPGEDEAEASVDVSVDSDEEDAEGSSDEFGAAEASAGPEKEPLGREMKEEGSKSTKKVLEATLLSLGDRVTFIDRDGAMHFGKIARKHSDMAYVVTVGNNQHIVSKSSITPVKESELQKKKLSDTDDLGEGNAFAAAVQQAKASGKKPGDKFEVDGKEYTLEDLQRECQYYDQQKLADQGAAMASKYQAFSELVTDLQSKGVDNAVVLAAFLGRKKFGPQFFQNASVYESKEVMEKAPPGEKAERFIKSNKESFKKRYGKDWERVLYATAWKQFGESANFALKAKTLIEQYDPLWNWSDSAEEKQAGEKLQNDLKETLGICASWQKPEIKNHWQGWLSNTLRLDPKKYPLPEVKQND